MTKQDVKFSIAAYGFREFSLKDNFQAAVDLGIDAIEIDCGWLPLAKNKVPIEPTKEKIAEIKELEGKTGVKVIALGSGAVCGVDGQKIVKSHVEEIKKVIDVADLLDARIVRVFVEKEPDWSAFTEIQPPTTPEMFETIGEYFCALGAYAHQRNVVLGIENIGGEIAGTGPDIKRILDLVPYKEIGVLYDPANFHGFNRDFKGVDPYEALQYFKNRVVYTHWKDCIRTKEEPEYCIFGEGATNWSPIIKTLLESFDGYWCIEHEMDLGTGIVEVIEETKVSLDNLRKMITAVKEQNTD